MANTYDCVVIGGGPAGSSFASIVKKYGQFSDRVVVLEKSRFPRYHIGESTIPVVNSVLEDLGVLPKLEEKFIKKIGIVFIWGKNREPWSADYLGLQKINLGNNHYIDVIGQDFTKYTKGGKIQTPFHAFNVKRSEFDKILLDQSLKFGAEVREGTHVTNIQNYGLDRSIVHWENDSGERGSIETSFILDASGQNSVLANKNGNRIYDDTMNNLAIHGYLTDAEWKVRYLGEKEQTTVFIVATEIGWIWYIPLEINLISVGIVTNTKHFKDRLEGRDLENFFWDTLNSCPELSGLIKKAKLKDDIIPNGKKIATCKDWAYWSKQSYGPGWAAAGDAAVFVDPILSSGVSLALMSGHRAAYIYNTIKKQSDIPSASLWRSYQDYLNGEYGAFQTLARYFYGNNQVADSWWWEAQRYLNKGGRLNLDNKQAFTLATAGFLPWPKAIGYLVSAPAIKNITGTDADLTGVYTKLGIPQTAKELLDCNFKSNASFRLDISTEPISHTGTGELDVFYDLITDTPEFMHRIAIHPCRINPEYKDIVKLISKHRTVRGFVKSALKLLPKHNSDDVKSALLGIIKAAAIKGFITLLPRTQKK